MTAVGQHQHASRTRATHVVHGEAMVRFRIPKLPIIFPHVQSLKRQQFRILNADARPSWDFCDCKHREQGGEEEEGAAAQG